MTTSRVVRDVCARKPDQRGRDLLLILDRMVKGRKKGDSGSEETATLVMTLAMDGIAHLCRAGLIDIRTTLKVSPKCTDCSVEDTLSSLGLLSIIIIMRLLMNI